MKEQVLHTNKHWRDIKGGGKKAVKCFFGILCYFFYPTVVRFSVFVLITTNLMAREREKGGKKNKEKKVFTMF